MDREKTTDSDRLERVKERTRVRGIMKIVAFGVVLFWALNHISAIGGALSWVYKLLTPIIVGVIVGFIMNTILDPLEALWGKIFRKPKKFLQKLRRPVCIILSFLIIVGILFAVVFMLVPELERTGNLFITQFTKFVRGLEVKYKDFLQYLTEHNMALPEFEFKPNEIINNVTSFLGNFLGNKGEGFIDKTFSTIGMIFTTLFDAVLGIAFAFYFVAQKEQIFRGGRKVVYAVLPERRADRVLRVSSLIGDTFTRFVSGQVTEALIIGIMCFIGMLIFRFPYPLVISVLVALTALIPMFGSFIGTAIGAILIIPNSFFTALWFVLFIIVLQQLENNLIYPKVVGKSMGLPGLLVLVAITIGGSIFGFMGMIFSVPVCSVIYVLSCEFVSDRLEKKSQKVQKKAE